MKSEEFYKKLKQTLDETTVFPSKYLYKFIVPTKGRGVEDIEQIFDHLGAVITTKESSKGKYTAVSIEVELKNSDSVIDKYKEVAQIKGVISL